MLPSLVHATSPGNASTILSRVALVPSSPSRSLEVPLRACRAGLDLGFYDPARTQFRQPFELCALSGQISRPILAAGSSGLLPNSSGRSENPSHLPRPHSKRFLSSNISMHFDKLSPGHPQ